MKKLLLFILLFGSLDLFAINATITVNPQKKSDWKVDKLLFGSFQEEHWGDLTPGIYEQYIVNPSFEKWRWDAKHFKTGIVFFEIPEDEDVAYPWEKAYTGPGITYSLSKKNPKNSKYCQYISVSSGKKAGVKQQLALPDYRTLSYRYKFYIRKKGDVKIKVELVEDIPLNPPSKGELEDIPLNPPSKGELEDIPLDPPSKGELKDIPLDPPSKGELKDIPLNPLSKGELYVSGITNIWKEVEGIIKLDKKLVDRHKNRYGVAQFLITVEGNGEIWIDQATLFPADCVEDIYNPETIEYLKKFGVTMIRWPGGNYTSGYHWKDGIGPVVDRPTRWNPAWGGLVANHLGLDEFLRFCEITDIVPVMGVGFNLEEISTKEIADWVEYCNGDSSTPMGKLRAENGHPKPYNVINWGVGNEVYGHYQLGYTNAATYATELVKIISKMKKVDPKIKIIASGFGLHNKYRRPERDWNEVVLKIAGNKIDFIDMHTYVHGPNEVKVISEKISKPDLQKAFLSSNLSLEKFCDYLKKLLKSQTSTKNVKMAMLEWGILPAVWDGSPRRSTFANALIAASFYNTMIRNSDLIKQGAVHNFSYYVSPVSAHSEPINPRTHIAEIYSDMAGDKVIKVNVKSKKYSVKKPYIDIGTFSDVKDLDCVGTTSINGKIKLAILNRSQKNDYDVKINIQDIPENSIANLNMFLSEKPYEEYNWENNIKQFQRIVTKVQSSNNVFKISIPKMSFAYLTTD